MKLRELIESVVGASRKMMEDDILMALDKNSNKVLDLLGLEFDPGNDQKNAKAKLAKMSDEQVATVAAKV